MCTWRSSAHYREICAGILTCITGLAVLLSALLLGGCGGGSGSPAAGGDAPHLLDPRGEEPVVPAPADPDAEPTATERMLSAIPASAAGYGAAIAGELPAGPFYDGLVSEGGACRYWISDATHQLLLAFVFDFGSAAAAQARLAELRPAGAEDLADLGPGGSCGEHASVGGERGFILASFQQGSFVGFTGGAVLDASASAPDKAQVLDLARELSAALTALPAHSASQAAVPGVTSPSAAWPGRIPLSAARVTSLTFMKEVTVPLTKGTKNNGSISFKLEITPTDIACGQWGQQQPGVPSMTANSCDPTGPPSYCHIVNVFISRISLGDDDGDGAGRGDGDIIAGGELSLYFKRGIKSMKQTLSFSTGELGDCGPNSSIGGGQESETLPKFLKTLEGCGIPSAVDVDVLVRDNDEGADVVDVIKVLVVGAAEGGVGKSTGEAAAGLINELDKKIQDKTGTPGMQEARSHDGDDLGEAHDKQLPLLAS